MYSLLTVLFMEHLYHVMIARALSCCGSVLVLLWCCLAVAPWLVAQYCLIVGDRVKNIAIALCDRSPNSGAKHGQTKSTKNNQFYKITHLLCYFPCRVSV